MKLQYDCYDDCQRKHFEDTFESLEEIEKFLVQSSNEIHISLTSLKLNGKPVVASIKLQEE